MCNSYAKCACLNEKWRRGPGFQRVPVHIGESKSPTQLETIPDSIMACLLFLFRGTGNCRSFGLFFFFNFEGYQGYQTQDAHVLLGR